MRLGSATESIVFVKEASFLFPQRRVWIRRGSFVGTTTGTGRQKNKHKQNQTAAGSSLTEQNWHKMMPNTKSDVFCLKNALNSLAANIEIPVNRKQ